MKFKVVGTKPKRWWGRYSGARLVVFSVVHDDPNDWPLFGQIKVDIEDPERAKTFKKGQVYELDLTLVEE